jgi:type II secretion system protein I
MRNIAKTFAAAFTLLEVMIAVAFIGIALLALLSLHHSNLQSVIRGQDLTRAAMLAEAVMTQAEMERFPPPGSTRGDFSQIYPGQYPNFHWQRSVDASPLFPDVCRVEVRVFYGPRLRRSFDLIEFMHNPIPPQTAGGTGAQPNQPRGAPGNNGGLGD